MNTARTRQAKPAAPPDAILIPDEPADKRQARWVPSVPWYVTGGVFIYLAGPSYAFILLPIAAATAAGSWLLASRIKRPARIGFAPFWIGSLGAFVAGLYAVALWRYWRD